MTLGEKLSKLRKEYNYTQEQLADILGVSRQSISKWESDIAYPETDKLIRRLEREIEKQEKVIADLDAAIEAASADYQELTRLLGEKEKAEDVLMDLMEQWDAAQGE